MAQNGFIKIEDTEGNVLTQDASTEVSMGSGFFTDHGEEAVLYHFEQNALVPRNPSTGAMSAVRHEPAKFVKPIDKSTPLLLDALSNKTGLKITVVLMRDATTAAGEEVAMTATYEGVKLVSAMMTQPDTAAESTTGDASSGSPLQEAYEFVYDKAQWDGPDGSTSNYDRTATASS
ncbi:MAG: type VI secretion system tube protein TssD [Pseudomonadota bacterium]